MNDPTAEIKRIRHELGALDGFDLDRIAERTRRLEADYADRIVHRSARPARMTTRCTGATPPSLPVADSESTRG